MSKPLATEKVKEIRDIFDWQERNAEKSVVEPTQQRNPLKKDVLEELKTIKQRLDVQMDRFRSARPLDQTMMDVPAGDQTWMRSSDESFLRWEQDCETTMAPAGARKARPQDSEMAAIESLMREYNLDNQPADHLDVADQTQLADVEPPSGIWENTMIAAKMTSPVKMMHAIRPSTIIEETMSSNLANDSSMASSSYKTARSGGYDYSKATDRYDTAAETISSEESASDVIEILDDTIESRRKFSSEGNSAVGGGTLDGISSLAPDDESYGKSTTTSRDSGDYSFPESKDFSLDAPDFNDTLERIEYMEEQGKKLLEKQKNTPLLAKTLLPSSCAKKVFYPSPNSSCASSTTNHFKKPTIRSPQVKFVPPKRNFDHIVSPIATYIKDVPSSTLYTKYKGQCLFSKNSPIKPNTPTKKEDSKENQQSSLKPPQWNIPRKVFTSTNNRHEIDTRLPTKIPGGNKVHQMIHPAMENPHKIIKHEGRVKTGMQPPRNQPRDSIFDETLANMSVVSGDVSIQVIRDIKRH